MRLLVTLFLLGHLVLPGQALQIGPSTESRPVRSEREPWDAVWLDVPFFPQQRNGCGASSLAMVLRYWNSPAAVSDPQSIFARLYSDKLKGIAASQMKGYLEENGFRVFSFTGTVSDLRQHLLKGRPLIVALGGSSLHYLVVVGLDERQNLVLVNDPAGKKLSRMDERQFLAAWRLTNYWTLLAVPDARR